MSKFTTFWENNALSYDKGSKLAYGRLSGYPFLLTTGQRRDIGET